MVVTRWWSAQAKAAALKPAPSVLITCDGPDRRFNVFTWAGKAKDSLSSEPETIPSAIWRESDGADGPYGLLRHPIYTGLLAMYTGTALVTGESLAIIGLTLVALGYWRKVRLEEANLNVAFGADYDAIAARRGRCCPGSSEGPQKAVLGERSQCIAKVFAPSPRPAPARTHPKSRLARRSAVHS